MTTRWPRSARWLGTGCRHVRQHPAAACSTRILTFADHLGPVLWYRLAELLPAVVRCASSNAAASPGVRYQVSSAHCSTYPANKVAVLVASRYVAVRSATYLCATSHLALTRFRAGNGLTPITTWLLASLPTRALVVATAPPSRVNLDAFNNTYPEALRRQNTRSAANFPVPVPAPC